MRGGRRIGKILNQEAWHGLQLQAGGLALDTADHDVAGVLGDNLVIVEHGEF